jgi:hypothetical protein
MFQLSLEEFEILKSQCAISTPRWGGRRKRPFAFTEHGAIMAAGVAKFRAIERIDLIDFLNLS